MTSRSTRAVKDRRNELANQPDRYLQILQGLQAVSSPEIRAALELALLAELGLEVPATVPDESTEEE